MTSRATVLQSAAFVVLLAAATWLVVRGATAMPYQWQWERVPLFLIKTWQGHWYPGPLLRGLGVTCVVSAWAVLVALAAGLLAALLRLSASPVGRLVARAYVEIIRNTPLLVQLYLFYFVLAPILDIGRDATGVLCLGLFEGAFAAEIVRAGVLAVPQGQSEAARSLGLSRWQAMRCVVLPQAVRIVLPPLASLGVSTIKHSAIVSAIAIFDMASEGRTLIADTFMTFEVWLTVAALYLVVTTSLSAAIALLGRRLGRSPA